MKPASGCRSGFAFFDASGKLQQHSWAALKREGMAVFTERDGAWVRVRSNHAMASLGERTAIAPLGADSATIAALAVGTAASLDAKSIRQIRTLAELCAEPLHVVMFSNRYAMLPRNQQHLLSMYFNPGVRDSLNSTASWTKAQSAALLAFIDNPSEQNIATALAELERGTVYEQWQSHISPLCAMLNKRANLMPTDRRYMHIEELTGNAAMLDPSAAPHIITLLEALDPFDRYATSVGVKDQLELAISLAARFKDAPNPSHAATCFLANLPETTDPELARRAFGLLRAGAITPERALALSTMCPQAHELLRASLHRFGSVTDDTAHAIELAWNTDKLQAVLTYGDAHLVAVHTLFANSSTATYEDVAGVLHALSVRPNDKPTTEMATALAAIDQAAFDRALQYTREQNVSGIPHAELALRLTATFGSDLDTYLAKVAAPSESRDLISRRALLGPAVADAVLLARRNIDLTSIADLDERRAMRQAIGNAQPSSKENLQRRLDGTKQGADAARGQLPGLRSQLAELDADITASNPQAAKARDTVSQLEYQRRSLLAANDPQHADAIAALDIRIADSRSIVDGHDRLVANRSDAVTAISRAERKIPEFEALDTLLREYDSASDDRLAELTADWVARTAATKPATLGIALHDTAFWLPADPATAASFGEWMMRGDRATSSLKRPTGVAELHLISQAWPQLSKEQQTESFGRVLEYARTISGTNALGDRHTAKLAQSGATAASSQATLDLVRASYATPSPFDLTATFAAGNGAVTGAFEMRDSVEGPQLGMLSNCCQHLEGAGRACAVAGQTHPSMGFFVVRDGAGKVLSQSWVWADNTGGVCIDNVEGRPPPHLTTAVEDAYSQVCDSLTERFHTVTVGAHNTIAFANATLTSEPLDPASVGYQGYRDSKSQLLVRSRPDTGLVVIGESEGFTYKDGPSSVQVRNDTITLNGPNARVLAERMLPDMGPRTWNVVEADGSRSVLAITADERFRPNIDDLPLSVHQISPENAAHFARFAPDMDDFAATRWYTACNRDISLIESAVTNGWSIDQTTAVLSSSSSASSMLNAPPPAEAVVSAVASGYAPEQAALVFGKGSAICAVIDEARSIRPELPLARAAANAYVAQRATDPVQALLLLDRLQGTAHMEPDESQVAVVVELLNRGVEPAALSRIVQQKGNFGTEGLLSPRYVDEVRSLSNDQLEVLAELNTYSAYTAPKAVIALTKLPNETRASAIQADPSLSNPDAITYLLAGGAPEDWSPLRHAVFGDPAEIATLDAAALPRINAALESAGIPHAAGENAPPFYFRPATARTLADPDVLAHGVAVVAAMRDVSQERAYPPSDPTTFSHIAASSIRPSDAASLATHGVTAYALASALGDGGATGEQVAAIAKLAPHIDQSHTSSLLEKPAAIELATDVLTSQAQRTDEQRAADERLLKLAFSSLDFKHPTVYVKEAQRLWADPATRDALRSSAQSLETLADVIADLTPKERFAKHGGRRKPKRKPIFDF